MATVNDIQYVSRPKGKPDMTTKGKLNEWANEAIGRLEFLQNQRQEGVKLQSAPECGRQERRPGRRAVRPVFGAHRGTAQAVAKTA